MEDLLDLIERMTIGLIKATHAVPGGVKEFDRLIDEGLEAIRLTPHTADAACAFAGDGDDETRGTADV